ncbi:MAG: hypothetical protein PVI51_06380 [candidate division WOR-3 bacterium]|jgi:hypothetical protein
MYERKRLKKAEKGMKGRLKAITGPRAMKATTDQVFIAIIAFFQPF